MKKAEDIQFHRKKRLYFIFLSCEKYKIIFSLVKIFLFQIYIIFNQYFPVFHYFVYIKNLYTIKHHKIVLSYHIQPDEYTGS